MNIKEKKASKINDIDNYLSSLLDERITEENELLKNKRVVSQKHSFDEIGQLNKSESKEFTAKLPSEPDFIKVYLKDVIVLKGVQGGFTDILYAILKLMKYEDYIISISKYDKERIVADLDLKTTQQVDNAIRLFKKSGIFFPIANAKGKISRGTYEINPFLFGKGKWVENYNKRDVNKLTVLYRKNKKQLVNVDAIIEYIKTEKDEDKKIKAIEILEEITGKSFIKDVDFELKEVS